MKKSFIAVLMILCFIFLCSCTSKSDIAGVWKDEHGNYVYFYKEGVCDWLGKSGEHYNASTWELKDDNVIVCYPIGGQKVYTFSNNTMTDQQGNVRYKKVTDDVSKNLNYD